MSGVAYEMRGLWATWSVDLHGLLLVLLLIRLLLMIVLILIIIRTLITNQQAQTRAGAQEQEAPTGHTARAQDPEDPTGDTARAQEPEAPTGHTARAQEPEAPTGHTAREASIATIPIHPLSPLFTAHQLVRACDADMRSGLAVSRPRGCSLRP